MGREDGELLLQSHITQSLLLRVGRISSSKSERDTWNKSPVSDKSPAVHVKGGITMH